MRKYIILSMGILLAYALEIQEAVAESGPSRWVIVNSDGTSPRRPAIIVHFSRYQRGNTIERLSVDFSVSDLSTRSMPRVGIAGANWTELKEALQAGANADKSVLQKFGVYFARNTYCRSGPIKLNRDGRSFSDPASIRATLKHNNGQILGGTVPPGISGKPIPPIEYITHNVGQKLTDPIWVIRFYCKSPSPY